MHIAKITGRFDRNLNRQQVQLSRGADWKIEQKDYSSTSEAPGQISVCFKNLEDRLVSLIQEADVVVGCVAWLTSERILRSLSQKLAVSVVVQKEDFLRPDSKDSSKSALRRLYQKVPGLYRSNKATVEAAALETDQIMSEAWEIEGIRCVGFSRNVSRVEPNMHHKFAVFCRYRPGTGLNSPPHQYGIIKLYGIWTGSFNFTYNSMKSLENAVFMNNRGIAEAYFFRMGTSSDSF